MIADPVQKDAWKKKPRLKHLVFNRIIKHFMLAEKKAAKTRAMEGKSCCVGALNSYLQGRAGKYGQ